MDLVFGVQCSEEYPSVKYGHPLNPEHRLVYMISAFRKDGLPLVQNVEWGSSSRRRACGLIGAASLSAGRGLVLAPCRAIHTWFMRFTLDIIFFSREGRVVRLAPRVQPFRMVWGGWSAWGVMEMQSGWFPWAHLKEGDELIFKNEEDRPC